MARVMGDGILTHLRIPCWRKRHSRGSTMPRGRTDGTSWWRWYAGLVGCLGLQTENCFARQRSSVLCSSSSIVVIRQYLVHKLPRGIFRLHFILYGVSGSQLACSTLFIPNSSSTSVSRYNNNNKEFGRLGPPQLSANHHQVFVTKEVTLLFPSQRQNRRIFQRLPALSNLKINQSNAAS